MDSRSGGTRWSLRSGSTRATTTSTCGRSRPDLWSSRLPQCRRDPRARTSSSATASGCGCARTACSAAAATRATARCSKSLSAIGRAGIEDDGYRAGHAGAAPAGHGPRRPRGVGDLRTARARAARSTTPSLQDRCYAAWNDWAVEEFNAIAPDRLCVLAFLPATRRTPRSTELRALRARSATAARSSTCSGSTSPTGPGTALWAAAASAGIPLSFHLKGGSWSGLSYRMGEWQSAAFATVLPLQLDEPLATMLFSGALERHPELTLVLAESGIGWLPYFLARADLEWKSLRDKVADMPRTPPSELFRRQVMATFEEDALVAELLPLLGADRCMWASDYPHTDSTFPHSRRVIDETLGVAHRRRPPQGGRDELRRAVRLRRAEPVTT